MMFTFLWKNGKAEVLKEQSAILAMNNGGYKKCDLDALAFYSEGNRIDLWDFQDGQWIQTTLQTEN